MRCRGYGEVVGADAGGGRDRKDEAEGVDVDGLGRMKRYNAQRPVRA